MDITKTIKDLRQKKGFTQKNISERLYMARSTYSKIESGNTALDFKVLMNISKILEVPIAEIVKEHDSSIFKSVSEELSIMLHLTEHDLTEKLCCMIPFEELTAEHKLLLIEKGLDDKEAYENTPLGGRIYKFSPRDVRTIMFDRFGMDVLMKRNVVVDEYWVEQWNDHENRKNDSERNLENEVEIEDEDYFLVHIATLNMPGNKEKWVQFASHEFPAFEDEWKLLEYIIDKTGALHGDYVCYSTSYAPEAEILTFKDLNP